MDFTGSTTYTLTSNIHSPHLYPQVVESIAALHTREQPLLLTAGMGSPRQRPFYMNQIQTI